MKGKVKVVITCVVELDTNDFEDEDAGVEEGEDQPILSFSEAVVKFAEDLEDDNEVSELLDENVYSVEVTAVK